eukprot:gnl/TRDRNA2_/TRDRNA2_31921_c0_seq1.p1 gnl/TRDRNA2_/TRDRNA2_31921_c0~~gnl/TRDRNA2_/TRDRNA2_31921_c0_seq1.p1  ORF type:complete len:210 (-),score=48.26 gnl/TRDRNA2_/TRDRNA2_31921_c0_seq1:106-735(-)
MGEVGQQEALNALRKNFMLRMEQRSQELSAMLQSQEAMARLESMGASAGFVNTMQWNMMAKQEAQFAYMSKLLSTPEFVKTCNAEFDRIDVNKSGSLDANELEANYRAMTRANYPQQVLDQIPAKEITTAFLQSVDLDHNGVLSKEEWLLYTAYMQWQCFTVQIAVIEASEAQGESAEATVRRFQRPAEVKIEEAPAAPEKQSGGCRCQ